MTAVYSLSISGKSTIEVSQDELRAILGQIEAELHRSKVYRRALAAVQKMLGDSEEQFKQLFKAVGREAISIAFHQFAQQHKVRDNQADIGSSPNISADEAKPELEANSANDSEKYETPASNDLGDLSDCLTSAKFHSRAEHEDSAVDTVSETPISKTPILKEEVKQSNKKSNLSLPWSKNKKALKAELAKQAAEEQRFETLREIGKQLRQARELRGMSLTQLNIYTHVPIYQMEAIENGKWDSLPEEVYVRGFIRVMGNALGLNGTHLVASLPAAEPAKTIAPIWYKNQNNNSRGGGIGFDIKPMHLYMGYTALVVGAVGGLSVMSQQAEAKRLLPDSNASSSFTQTPKDKHSDSKPGLQSNGQVSVGAGIAAPEAL